MTAALIATLVCVACAVALALQGGNGGWPLIATAITFGGYLFVYFGFTIGPLTSKTDALLGKPATLAAAVGGMVAFYAIYAFGTHSFTPEAGLRLFCFLAIPAAVVLVAKSRGGPPGWLDLVAVLCLWAPFDTGLIKDIWTWPPPNGAFIMNTVLAVDLAALVFFAFRGLDGMNLKFRLSSRDALVVIAAVAGFLALAVPFGLATGFIAFNPDLGSPIKVAGTLASVFFFIAVPEEILFRGLVQNLLAKKLKRSGAALVITAIFFGLTHINNTPTPDWRYLTLAAVAGIFYGETYRRTRSILAPALVHASVDSIWTLFLMSEAFRGASGK